MAEALPLEIAYCPGVCYGEPRIFIPTPPGGLDSMKAAACFDSAEEIVLRFQGGKGFILSRTHGPADPVAADGVHRGILFGGRVYDNIHKEGLPLDAWLADFEGLGARTIERRPLGGEPL